jgi:hypothetical protein
MLPVGGPTSVSGFYGPVVLTDNGDDEAELATNMFYEARIDGGAVSLGNFDLV